MKLKHSKYKNIAIIFEILSRQISSDILNDRDSKALGLIKKYFGKASPLTQELKLYQALISEKNKNSSESKLLDMINLVIESRGKIDLNLLSKQKYNLIREINEKFPKEDLFAIRIPNYRECASIYQLLEYGNKARLTELSNLKNSVVNILLEKNDKPVVKTEAEIALSGQTKDMRLLTYKFLIENFNKKYTQLLSENQRSLMAAFITSKGEPSEVKLKTVVKDYAKAVLSELKTVKIESSAIKIKLKEIVKMLKEVTTRELIKEGDVLLLLKFEELVNEIKTAEKK